jgi:hypothetical protein
VIEVEDFAKEAGFLDLTARVTGPRGEALTVPLEQVAPRRYQATFPLWGKGRYQVMAAGTGVAPAASTEGAPGRRTLQERNEQALGGFAVPYSAEYLRFRSDPILLKQIAERTGGRVLDANDVDLFHPPRVPRESSRPVFDWFLLALCILVPLDVGVRRVQFDWEAIRAWLRPRRGEEGAETMGALLQRKAQVKEQRAERPPPVPTVRVPKPTPRPASSVPEPKVEEPAEPQSTTERLLARKRKRQGDEPK